MQIVTASSQSFHLKAQNHLDKDQWFKALEYGKHRATIRVTSYEDEINENNLLFADKNFTKAVDTVCAGFESKLVDNILVYERIG